MSVAPGLGDDHGDDRLDPPGVGDAEDGGFGHRWHLVDGLFYLAAGDVLPAGLDHVLLAVDDGEVAVFGHDAKVAGVEPAVAERRGGHRLIVVIAQRGVRAAVDDLADGAWRHRPVIVIDQPGFHVERGPARQPARLTCSSGPRIVASGAISVWP